MLIPETGVHQISERYFFTPSALARDLFYYPSRCGHYFCDHTYSFNHQDKVAQQSDHNNHIMLLLIQNGALELKIDGWDMLATRGQFVLFDRLLLIPDNIPPHKTMPEHSATSMQRLEMTRCMAEEIPHAQVTDMELTRGGRSYTVDTLRRLKETYPDSILYFIMGTDMLLSFDRWREPENICRLAHLVVIARDECDRRAIARKASWLKQTWQAQVEIVDCPALPVSSTEIRADRARCREMVPEKVFAYITAHQLYF